MKMRHFPLSYVVKALEAFVRLGEALPNAPNMTTEDFIAEAKTRGVDYDAEYDANIAAFRKSNAALANFQPEDFDYAVDGETVLHRESGEVAADAKAAKEIEKDDQTVLQGYGRPYDENGKPGGVFYSFCIPPGKKL